MPGESTALRIGVFAGLCVAAFLALLAVVYTACRWRKWMRRRRRSVGAGVGSSGSVEAELSERADGSGRKQLPGEDPSVDANSVANGHHHQHHHHGHYNAASRPRVSVNVSV